MAITTNSAPPCRRNCARRRLPALVMLCLPLALQSAFAEDWKFHPGIDVKETYSDNVGLSSDGGHAGAFVTELMPHLTLNGRGRHLVVALDYAPDLIFYSRSDNGTELLQNLRGTLQAELVEDLLYVDANAAISQQSSDIFGAPVIDNYSSPSNRSQARTLTLSPYLKHRFGNFAQGELRYARDRTSSSNSGLSNTNDDRESFALNSGTDFHTLTWGLTGSHQKIDFAGSPTVQIATYSGNARYLLIPTFALTATVGHEKYDYDALTNPPVGRFYSGGFAWHPSQRTAIEAEVGHRFYGRTYMLSASQRARQSAWMLAYNEDISTTQQKLAADDSFNTEKFLERLYRTALPDAAVRKAYVDALIRETGLPANVATALNTTSNRFFLEKSLRASYAFNGVHNTVILTAVESLRRAQSKSNVDPALINAGANFRDDSNTRQLGLQALWNWRLTSVIDANFTLGTTRVHADDSDFEVRTKTARATLSKQMTSHMKASIELSRIHQNNSDGANIDQNAIAAVLSTQY